MARADDWKNATAALPPHALGRVLRPDEFSSRARYDFAAPAAPLLPWVERYWSVHWDLAPGEAFRAATLTEPALNLTCEFGGVARAGQTGAGFWLTGPVARRRFDVELTGTGGVLGVKFRVGAGPAFGIADPGALIGKTAEAAAWFPHIGADWRRLGLGTGGIGAVVGEARAAVAERGAGLDAGAVVPGQGVGTDPSAAKTSMSATAAKSGLDAWFGGRMPDPDPAYDRLCRVLAILDDPAVTQLGDVADRADCSARTLERLFRAYVGTGPKWMLTRARVIDAVAALDAGTGEPLSDLAVRLGWFDQAHFTTDFRRIVGTTPQEYRKSRPRTPR